MPRRGNPNIEGGTPGKKIKSTTGPKRGGKEGEKLPKKTLIGRNGGQTGMGKIIAPRKGPHLGAGNRVDHHRKGCWKKGPYSKRP